jgi:hypothetical protein
MNFLFNTKFLLTVVCLFLAVLESANAGAFARRGLDNSHSPSNNNANRAASFRFSVLPEVPAFVNQVKTVGRTSTTDVTNSRRPVKKERVSPYSLEASLVAPDSTRSRTQ